MKERFSTELKPIYDGRKSFYGKAIVTRDCEPWGNSSFVSAEGERHLYSYDSHIAYIDGENKVHLLPLWNYSATTLRHTKEFLKQNGFRADFKKQMEKDYL